MRRRAYAARPAWNSLRSWSVPPLAANVKYLLPARLVKLLSQRQGMWLTLLLALVLTSPALLVGWVIDDHMHQLVLRGTDIPWLQRGPLELYSFMPQDPVWQRMAREDGAMPWYADPQIYAALWRPLSSLPRYLDYLLAPDSAAVAHIHSIAWYLALVAAVRAVYERLLPQAWMVGLASLLYAVDDAHGLAVGWVANRHAVVSLALATVGLWLHLRWRQDGDRRAQLLAPVLLALGLLAGEMALCIVGYLVAFALLLDRGTLGRRLLSLAPAVGVVVVWRVAYTLQGFGVGNSTMYIDPALNPVRFVGAAAWRLPLLLQGQLLPVPPELVAFFADRGPGDWAVVAAGLVALLIAVCWRRARGDRLVPFFVLSMVLSAVPACATTPHNRLLLPVGIAGSGLVAWLVAQVRDAPLVRSSAGAGVLARVWLVVHLWLAAILLPAQTYSVRLFGDIFEAAAASLDGLGGLQGRTLVIVNGPNFFQTSWTMVVRLSRHLPVPARLRVLGTTEDQVQVTTVDDHTLRLTPAHGYVNNLIDEMLRTPDRPAQVGDGQCYDDLAIEVTDVTPDGRPAEVVSRFARPLSDPEYLLVAWTRERGYQLFVPPPVGASLRTEAVTKLDLARYSLKKPPFR